MKRLLVTGGAGYVGSHCARSLAAEAEVVTLDNLSTGHREAVSGELVVADLLDLPVLRDVLSRGFDAVLHFAGQADVPGSVRDPLAAWHNNVGGTLNLLAAMAASDCRRIVFSSTCAVHGSADGPLAEDLPFRPASPYAESKAIVERMLVACGFEAVSLRYFNAVGASDDGWLGEAHDPETHLVPLALMAARIGRPIRVFGTDHPTPDGTCVRDYVDVRDLADAHRAAVARLLDRQGGGAWHLGTGRGHSVLEVLDRVEAVTGVALRREIVARRDGDVAALVADPRRAAADLGWRPRRTLDDAIAAAWAWHRSPRFGRDFER